MKLIPQFRSCYLIFSPLAVQVLGNKERLELWLSPAEAATVEQAEDTLAAFAHKWDSRYPTISQLWLRHWE